MITQKDVGKICVFWDNLNESKDLNHIGILTCISKLFTTQNGKPVKENRVLYGQGMLRWKHCRRLTEQEIKELC